MELITTIDIAITDYIFSMGADTTQPGGFLYPIIKIMEYTMHGVPWLAGSIIGIYLTDNPSAAHFLMNLLFAILVDLIVVGVLKLALRRPRPRDNRGHMIAEAPYVDQFSFPSGHTSRAAMLTKLLITLTSMATGTKLMVCCFPVALGLSRIMLGRHYFSDVLAGLVIGLIESDLMVYYCWLPPEPYLAVWRFIKRKS